MPYQRVSTEKCFDLAQQNLEKLLADESLTREQRDTVIALATVVQVIKDDLGFSDWEEE